MSQPSVSVVMVVRNVERFLAESVESILAQTYSDFEFIIVDVGSTDNSKAIVCQYAATDSRVRFHQIPPCGLGEARNASWSLARGRLIAIMDADDISLPNRLTWEVEFLDTHPNVGLVGGAAEWIDARGKAWGVHACPTEDDEIKSAFADFHPFYHPALLIRRELFDLVGGYRPAFAPAEDYDLTMRISEHCQCTNLNRVLLKYRIHAHQQSLQKRKQQTYGRIAAQVSAAIRRAGKPDPLDSAPEITASLLSNLGVTYAKQQHEVAVDRYQWIRNLCAVGESSFALNAIREILQSDLKHVDRWLIADLRLLAARLHWKQRRFARSFFAAAHAIVIRPAILGRPLKPYLRVIS